MVMLTLYRRPAWWYYRFVGALGHDPPMMVCTEEHPFAGIGEGVLRLGFILVWGSMGLAFLHWVRAWWPRSKMETRGPSW